LEVGNRLRHGSAWWSPGFSFAARSRLLACPLSTPTSAARSHTITATNERMTCSYTKLRIAAALQRPLGGLSAPNPTTAPAAALWLTALTSACEDPNGSQRHSTDATDGPSAEPDSTPTRSDSVVKGRHESDASSERDAAVTPGAERNRALEP